MRHLLHWMWCSRPGLPNNSYMIMSLATKLFIFFVASQAKAAFPTVKVNKKTCNVKIGGVVEKFAYGEASPLDVVQLAHEFQVQGKAEFESLGNLSKTLGFK